MSTFMKSSPGHARQLSRVLGILDAMDATGNEAIVVADVRDAIETRAGRIHYDVEPHEFASIDAPEWRSLATFCDELATRGLVSGVTKMRARTLADVAEERLRGERE